MRILVLLLLSLLLNADSRTLQRKADEKRAAEYHRLTAKSKRAAANVSEFVERWSRDCQARSQELKLDSTGDPGCQNKPPEAKKDAK